MDHRVWAYLNNLCKAGSGLQAGGEVRDIQIFCWHESADVVSQIWVEINLLKGAANNGYSNQNAIMDFFPSFIFLKYLITHMVSYTSCPHGFDTFWIIPIYLALHYVRAGQKGLVGPSVKLQSRNRNHRKLDVGAVRPRKGLLLRYLGSQFEGSSHLLFPRHTTRLINEPRIINTASDGFAICL